jgi:hypothetical protein
MDTWVLCCPSDLTPSIGEPAEKRAALLLAKQSRNILIRAVLCTAMPQARAVCLRETLEPLRTRSLMSSLPPRYTIMRASTLSPWPMSSYTQSSALGSTWAQVSETIGNNSVSGS